jgi:hypothetical protein
MIPNKNATDMWAGFQERMGNILFPMTVPVFASLYFNRSWCNIIKDWVLLPAFASSSRKRVMLATLLKIFGINGLQKMAPLYKVSIIHTLVMR